MEPFKSINVSENNIYIEEEKYYKNVNDTQLIFLTPKIKEEIVQNVVKSKIPIEIEFRFSEYFVGNFGGVDRRTFSRLKEYYSKKNIKREMIYTTDKSSNIKYTDELGNNISYTIRKSIYNDGSIQWMQKQRIHNYDDYKNYYLRLATNYEKILHPEKINESLLNFDNVRTKDRTSFYITGKKETNTSYDILRVDLTYVVMDDTTLSKEKENKKLFLINIGKTTKYINQVLKQMDGISYEVEIEILDIDHIDEIEPYIHELLRAIQDTEIIYSHQEYQTIVSYVNQTLDPTYYKSSFGKEISSRNIHQARNLKYDDP